MRVVCGCVCVAPEEGKRGVGWGKDRKGKTMEKEPGIVTVYWGFCFAEGRRGAAHCDGVTGVLRW